MKTNDRLAFDRLATNDAQDDDFLNSNDRVDLKIAPASDTGVSIGSHLKGAGVNYCGTEYDENCTCILIFIGRFRMI